MLSEQFFTQNVEFKRNFCSERIQILRENKKNTKNLEESEKINRMILGYEDLLKKLDQKFNS